MCLDLDKIVLTEDYETVKNVLNSPDWANRFPSHPRFKEHMLYKNLGKRDKSHSLTTWELCSGSAKIYQACKLLGLMWGDSEPHRVIRKFTFQAFRAIGFGELKQAEEFLQEELQDFIGSMDARLKGSTRNELYMQHTFKIPTFNIFWRVMSGERFSYDDEKIKKLIDAVDDVSQINIGMDPEWIFPILRYIPGCSPSRAKRQSFVTCHEFFVVRSKLLEFGQFMEYKVIF